MQNGRLQPKIISGHLIPCIIAYHRTAKEADEMDAYNNAAKGIDKDKFVKGMFSYESLWQ